MTKGPPTSLLGVVGVSKTYPGVKALAGIDFDLEAGEIHALLGENGAGKSTFIKVLAGAVVPDTGSGWLGKRTLPFGDPLTARRQGISIIYQEFTLVPELTAAENIFLGRERGAWLRTREMRTEAQRLLDSLGARIDASATVDSLSVAQQQLVEIARALSTDSRVLILDEPTATLSGPEVERLFGVLRDLRGRGHAVIYISHRLEEIFKIADRVTVLRDGKKVATAPLKETDRVQLIRWMVGRDVSEEFPARSTKAAEPLLDVRGLTCRPCFFDVSFTVRQGEIVGLAGLVGAGRTSVGLALFGALSSHGEAILEGRPIRFGHPSEAIAAGVAYITEDRKGRGLFPLLGAGANITMAHLAEFARAGWLSRTREDEAARTAGRRFDLRAAGLGQAAATLSGGNQQKLLLARYLLKPLRLLILDEPTRGIDVGAKAEIYRLMNRLTAEGLGILMISSELPEILGMSDRIVVMHEGRVTGELSHDEATPERVMELATRAR